MFLTIFFYLKYFPKFVFACKISSKLLLTAVSLKELLDILLGWHHRFTI